MADDDLKALQIRAKYHAMLKQLSDHNKRSMIKQLEVMVEREFKKLHPLLKASNKK